MLIFHMQFLSLTIHKFAFWYSHDKLTKRMILKVSCISITFSWLFISCWSRNSPWFDLLYLECEIGKYGVNCQSTCGSCLVQNQCSHINGVCSGGCAAGYTGDLCRTSKEKQGFGFYIYLKWQKKRIIIAGICVKYCQYGVNYYPIIQSN